MKADLHFHSKFSDGSYWPEKLVEMAKEKGLEMIALTDHDTFKGVSDFMKASDKFNIDRINPGTDDIHKLVDTVVKKLTEKN